MQTAFALVVPKAPTWLSWGVMTCSTDALLATTNQSAISVYLTLGLTAFLALNSNQVLMLHLNHLAHLGDELAQDAVLELAVDILLLDLIPHIKAAAAGTDETFPAQIPLVLDIVVVRVLYGRADAEVAIL